MKESVYCLAAVLLGFACAAASVAGEVPKGVDNNLVQEMLAKDRELSIQDIQTGYADGRLTSEALVKSYIERIRKYEPAYNAFTSINPDAVDDARAIDSRRRAGGKLGVLAGIPIIIKESIDVAGLPSTAGWAPLSKQAGGLEVVPEFDAPVVKALRDQGAIIIGKGNIPAFSFNPVNADSSWAGPTYNAVNRRFVPGGSSSGVATAVSANFVVLGLAEETMGSIQNPSAAQAIVGIKPTFGLVPNTGAVPIGGSTLDVLGPLARSVHDAAIMLDVMAGYNIADPKTIASIGHVPEQGYAEGLRAASLSGNRIGLYGVAWAKRSLSPETDTLYQAAIAVLENNGAKTVDNPFAETDFAGLSPTKGIVGIGSGQESMVFDLDRYFKHLGKESPIDSFQTLVEKTGKNPFAKNGLLAEAWKFINASSEDLEAVEDIDFSTATDNQRAIANAHLKKLRYPGVSVAPPDLSVFSHRQEKYLRLFNQVMMKHDLDALVFPQALDHLPLASSEGYISATAVPQINVLGLPAITVPAGYYQNGAPFSLIIIGKKWTEAQLLAIAYGYEQASKQRVVPRLHNITSKDKGR